MEVYRDQSRRKLILLNLEFPEIRKSQQGVGVIAGNQALVREDKGVLV
jgi:hypothetical protein